MPGGHQCGRLDPEHFAVQFLQRSRTSNDLKSSAPQRCAHDCLAATQMVFEFMFCSLGKKATACKPTRAPLRQPLSVCVCVCVCV